MQEREISIVVPCYNEAPALPHLYTELTALKQKLPGVSFEFVLVDDGSTDGTRDVIRDLSQNDADVRYVFFSRNFGKEAALLAGLEAARGKYVAVMDADLQDPPSLLPAVSYTHLRAHETPEHLVCRLLLEKKKKNTPTH